MQVDLGFLQRRFFLSFKIAQFFLNTIFFQDLSQDYIGKDDIIYMIEVIVI